MDNLSVVSLRWVRFLEELLSKGNDDAWLSLGEVEKIATDNGVKRVKQMYVLIVLLFFSSMNYCAFRLQFFHELGVIVHLTATEELKKTVTINPQWLLDALTKVIRDDIHVTDELYAAGLNTEFTRLRKEGIAR